jgi:alpha-tubulin suppressor-like RCC1 family protein
MAACGYYHTLLVTEDGGLWSCGAGSHGQLGHKDCAHQRTPAPLQAKVFGGSRVLEAVAGPRHTIAVVAEGSLWTWGGGIEGQLGSGDMPERRAIPKNLPRAAFGGTPVVLASAGDDHSLALTADGQVWTWGSGREAQQGGDDRIHHLTPACLSAECFGGAKVVSVAAGDDHCVALTAQGDVMTWGRGAYGRLGHNDQDDRRTPTPITRDLFENAPAVFISAGKFHSAAISSDGNLWLWGWNEWGQLGNGDRAHRLVPARLKYVERFECSRVLMVSCGAFHTLALTERGAAWSWGRNTQAQLGLDDRQDRLLPTQILSVLFDDARLCMVTAGLMHSAAVGEDGTLWTWGAAGCDALDPPTPTGLGHGDLQDKLVPTKVSFTGHQHMRIGSCRSLLLQHALVFSMASRQRLGHSDKLELILDQIVEQIVEMEDGIVMKRKLLAVKQSKLEVCLDLMFCNMCTALETANENSHPSVHIVTSHLQMSPGAHAAREAADPEPNV